MWAAPWMGRKELWLKAPQNFLGVVDLEGSLKAGKPCWKQQYNFGAQKKDCLYRPVFPLSDSVFWISCAEVPHGFIPNENLRKNPDGSVTILSQRGIVDYPAKNLYWLEYNYASSMAQDTIWYTDYTDLQDYERIFLTCETILPDRLKIAVAFREMNQVLFFNRKNFTSKLLTTSTKLPLANPSDDEIQMHYSGICCTDKMVLVFRAFPEDPRLGIGKDRSISVFDWNGQFKYQLNVDHPLKAPFLDEEKGFLYAADEEDNIRMSDVKDFL